MNFLAGQRPRSSSIACTTARRRRHTHQVRGRQPTALPAGSLVQGAAQTTPARSHPASRAEPVTATAAAARPAERTPPAPQGGDSEPEEAPVAARMRNSPVRLAEAAHAQEDAAAEGVLVATTRAVKLLSAEKLDCKRASGFRLPLGCPTSPWPTDAAALRDVNHWVSDHRKEGGGWSVTWLRGRQPGNSAYEKA